MDFWATSGVWMLMEKLRIRSLAVPANPQSGRAGTVLTCTVARYISFCRALMPKAAAAANRAAATTIQPRLRMMRM